MLKISLFFRLRLSLILVISTALVKTGNWSFLGIYAIFALSWCLILKTPLYSLIKLLGVELIFLALMALPLGWEKASFLLTRSLLCLLIMNSFVLTIPKNHLAIALKGLPLPAKMQEIIILTVQYLEILLSEIKRMQTAAKLRGLNGNSHWLRYINAAMLGSLYLRSLDRAERIYNAMIIRGYQGSLPLEITPDQQDNFFLIMFSVITIIITLNSYGIWLK